MLKNTLLFIFFLMALAGSGAGQPTHRRYLSVPDSLTVQRYLDSANAVSIFSVRHQHYLDSALAIAPWMAGWWQQKAMPLFKQKKYELGIPFLDSAVKYDARRYTDYRAFMKCIFQKSYRSAIVDFHQAKAFADNGVVMDHSYDFYLGLCYLQLNNFDSASFFLSKTIDDERRSVGSKWINPLDWFYLGIVSYEQGQYPEAQQLFDSALTAYPHFSDAKVYKAACMYRSGKSGQGKELMKEAEDDFGHGYTFTDINAIHEPYPYQVSARTFSK
jgi:tetratricopeptide (TPR) repeat protein